MLPLLFWLFTGPAKAYTVNQVVKAVIHVESRGNARAVSKHGAIGLMQLKPTTAAIYGVRDLFNPHENIRAGKLYLTFLLNRYHGNLCLALAGYNMGPSAIHGSCTTIPPIAKHYVSKVFRFLKGRS